jgi:hypothetical protein
MFSVTRSRSRHWLVVGLGFRESETDGAGSASSPGSSSPTVPFTCPLLEFRCFMQVGVGQVAVVVLGGHLRGRDVQHGGGFGGDRRCGGGVGMAIYCRQGRCW